MHGEAAGDGVGPTVLARCPSRSLHPVPITGRLVVREVAHG
jgi:hypothetical protein